MKDDDEARKLWEQELQDTEVVAATGKSTKGLVDPHGEVKDGDKFLMEFMTHKKWLENGADKFNPDKDNDDDIRERQGRQGRCRRLWPSSRCLLS